MSKSKMLFSAEISDFRVIYNVLRAIAFTDFAMVRAMEEGLKFTLEEMKSVETSAYIPRNMFTCYHVDDKEDVVFKISTKTFIECLNIFGDEGNPSFKLSYKQPGSPLCLVIKHSEENITVDCEIKTMSVDDFPDVSLAGECNINKVVINASILSEILQKLDNNADEITLSLSSEPPHFTLTTTGIAGESTVNMSKYSDSITIFQCKEECTAKYALGNLKLVLKVMHYANKVAITTGAEGLLGLQLVINVDDKQMYVECYVSAQFADDD